MWAYLYIKMLLFMYFMLLYSYFSSALCQLQGHFHLNGRHQGGDVLLGGLFGMHFYSVFPDLSFTSEPQQPTCHG